MVGGDRVPGGHRVQIDETARALIERGIKARISFDEFPDLVDVDLVHGFGLPAESMRIRARRGKPIVLSTIYWSRQYTQGLDERGFSLLSIYSRCRLAASVSVSILKRRHPEKFDELSTRWREQRQRFELADALLPNSQMEADQIKADLGVTTPTYVVPNAVDPERFIFEDNAAEARDGVIYAGRIEPHKNQLGLVKALQRSSFSLTLIGNVHPHHKVYGEKVRSNLGGRHQVLDGCDHDTLVGHYRRHRVHVLPSWFETTGLVSLESALCGCRIVTTERGYARDYFGDHAFYCDPARPASIRRAIDLALQDDRPMDSLIRKIKANFTWKHTALATETAYRSVLSESSMLSNRAIDTAPDGGGN